MAEKISDFFRYARDVAAIHFAGYQRNDHVLSTSDWVVQQEAERAYHQPGQFVALPGFEWSAQTTRGGHHNVYFRRHDQPIRRSGHEGLDDKSDEDTDLRHITEVYEAYRGTDTVITAHVGGEHSDLQYHDPYLEPAVEVTSESRGPLSGFCRRHLSAIIAWDFSAGAIATTGDQAGIRRVFSIGVMPRRDWLRCTRPS